MKKVYVILILSLFACKPGKEAVAVQEGEPMLHYSKGPCLGRCPVYDFWIYPNGNFMYKKAKGIKSNGPITGRFTSAEMEKLKTSLQNNLEEPQIFKRVRDLPISKIRFDGKTYEYHANKAKGGLNKVNTLIEDMVRNLEM